MNTIKIIKNVKIFFTLAMGIHFLCNASEKNESKALVPVLVIERVDFEEIVQKVIESESNASRSNVAELLYDCYRNNNYVACQDLTASVIYRNMVERAALHGIIAGQQRTINTHEETINNFNEREARKTKRINKRKTQRNEQQ